MKYLCSIRVRRGLSVLLAVLLLASWLAVPQPVYADGEQYHGGDGDGFTFLESSEGYLNPLPRFLGGSGDGFTFLESSGMQLNETAITLTANPDELTADGTSTSTLTATVKNQYGNNVEDGTVVNFSTDHGTLSDVTTTTNGVATATLTSESSTETIVATVTATANGVKDATAVFFIPEGGAGVEDSKTEETSSGDDTVDAKNEADTEVDKSGSGTPIITVAKYESCPECGSTPGGFQATGDYIDVHLDTTTNVTEIQVKNYYTAADIAGLVESSLRMYYCTGSAWVQCSDSGVTYPAGGPTYRGYVWAKIRADTTPDLTYLAGGMFGAKGTAPAAPGVVGPTFFCNINNLTITPTEVKIGEAVTITVQVKNKGDGAGSCTATLKINDVIEEKKTVTLAANEKKTVTFTVIKDEVGTYKVQVNGLKGEFIVGATASSATFEVTDLSISPVKVKAGETVTISVLVAETSGCSGSYSVALKINDEVVATEEVTLAANASQTVTFTIADQEAGSYKVEVNGLVGEFIVEETLSEASTPPAPAPPAKSPINWTIIWYIVGGVVVVGLIISFMVRRRAY